MSSLSCSNTNGNIVRPIKETQDIIPPIDLGGLVIDISTLLLNHKTSTMVIEKQQ